MHYPRFIAPLHVRMYRTLCWYIRLFFTHIPDIIAGLSAVALMILLPILAAFVV